MIYRNILEYIVDKFNKEETLSLEIRFISSEIVSSDLNLTDLNTDILELLKYPYETIFDAPIKITSSGRVILVDDVEFVHKCTSPGICYTVFKDKKSEHMIRLEKQNIFYVENNQDINVFNTKQ